MTTVTLPRATVEQALEALESVQPQNMGPLIHPAKQALRAALEQQSHTDDLNQRIKLYVGSRCAPPRWR